MNPATEINFLFLKAVTDLSICYTNRYGSIFLVVRMK